MKTIKELKLNEGDVIRSMDSNDSYEVKVDKGEHYLQNGCYTMLASVAGSLAIWEIVSRAEPEPSFIVGDKVVVTSDFFHGNFYGITKGTTYTVVDTQGYMVFITNDKGERDGYHHEHFKAAPVTEEPKIVAGNTYTTYNEGEWHCIYTTDEHAYMIQHEGQSAYVWCLDGAAISLASDKGYNVRWGPVVEEGVSIEEGVLTIGGLDWFVKGVITTVDGVPDWNTISVVSSRQDRQPTSAKKGY